MQGLHSHSFRWDHAIAFARWALADACSDDITAFLIEALAVEMGRSCPSRWWRRWSR